MRNELIKRKGTKVKKRQQEESLTKVAAAAATMSRTDEGDKLVMAVQDAVREYVGKVGRVVNMSVLGFKKSDGTSVVEVDFRPIPVAVRRRILKDAAVIRRKRRRRPF